MDQAATVSEAAHTAPRPRTSLTTVIEREHKRHLRARLIWIAVAVLIPVLAVGAWVLTRPRPVPMAQRFAVASADVGDITREVQATGHLEAESTVVVGAEVSGRVQEVLVDFNDHVHAGQVLARFDPASLQAQVDQIAASIAASHATLAQAQSDRDQARQNLTRAQRLFATHTLSEAERDQAGFALRSAQARVRSADAQIAAQQAAYALARTNLGHTEIVAPIDGMIITRNVDPGQTMISALQSPQLFSVAADLQHMRVIAAVDEADVGQVEAQQRVIFSVNAYPDRHFEGVVVEVRNAPVVVQDVVTYGTVISVDNHELLLRPGMTASVRIRTGTAQGVLRVPNAALHFTPPGETMGTTPEVWTLQGETLHRVTVTPGLSDALFTEVQSASLARGARVVTELTHVGRQAYGIAH